MFHLREEHAHLVDLYIRDCTVILLVVDPSDMHL